MTEIFAVFVQADIPLDAAETIFVPLGITWEIRVSFSRSIAGSVHTLNNGLVEGKVPLDIYLPTRRV